MRPSAGSNSLNPRCCHLIGSFPLTFRNVSEGRCFFLYIFLPCFLGGNKNFQFSCILKITNPMTISHCPGQSLKGWEKLLEDHGQSQIRFFFFILRRAKSLIKRQMTWKETANGTNIMIVCSCSFWAPAGTTQWKSKWKPEGTKSSDTVHTSQLLKTKTKKEMGRVDRMKKWWLSTVDVTAHPHTPTHLMKIHSLPVIRAKLIPWLQ